MKRITKGGMFDEQRLVVIEEADPKAVEDYFDEWMNTWNTRLADCPHIFEAAQGGYRDFCLQVIEAGRPGDEEISGTLESFARDVVTYFEHANRSISEGDAASAARFAFTAGEKFELMRLKFSFEKDAERGTKVIGGSRNSALERNRGHVTLREKRFSRIRELTAKGGTNLASAAAQCEVEGLGSQKSILQQWHRAKRRLRAQRKE